MARIVPKECTHNSASYPVLPHDKSNVTSRDGLIGWFRLVALGLKPQSELALVAKRVKARKRVNAKLCIFAGYKGNEVQLTSLTLAC